jgi:hypothetical protein
MRNRTLFLAGFTALFATAALGKGTAPSLQSHAGAADGTPVVQLAVLLDTSNSMDGLIDQARSELWKIVNEFSYARRGGRAVRLHVALYEYGNAGLAPSGGYVRQVLPFTTDLDRVSEELFALKTHGGDEYCGTVLQRALDELRWSRSPDDLRVVFIAGNEPFTQGPVDVGRACRRARARSIFVNTIHCGPESVGAATGWRDGAVIARGSFSTIEQDRAVVHMDAPQDGEIARLGIEINKTYVPYGVHGGDGQKRQHAQDGNASRLGPGAATHRAVTKSHSHYSNAGWDLVDAYRQGQIDLSTVEAKDLPVEMRGLKVADRKAFVETKAREREALQQRIQKLNEARREHVASRLREQGAAPEKTLDVAVIQALRDQAAQRGIELR